MKFLLYFGCMKDVGHYLWLDESNTVRNAKRLEEILGAHMISDLFLRNIDNVYNPPSYPKNECVYRESLVPPFKIVAWNDYSMDKRPGSNSALLSIGYEFTKDVIKAAEKKFPTPMSRQRSELFPESALENLARGC